MHSGTQMHLLTFVFSDIHDFSVPSWPFHSEEQRAKWAEEVMQKQGKGRRTYAKNHCGVVGSPLFALPLKQIIPCNMHAVMAILKKLVRIISSIQSLSTYIVSVSSSCWNSRRYTRVGGGI